MSFHFRCRRRKYTLGTCVVFLVGLTFWMLRRPTIKVQFQKTNSNADQDTATEKSALQKLDKRILDQVLLKQESHQEHNTSAGTQYSVQFYKKASDKKRVLVPQTLALGTEERKILEHLLFMQEAAWEPNPAAVTQYRAELGHCCNASFRLVVTRENTPRKSHIIFDGENTKMLVNAELTGLLPERSPFSQSQYRRCAVVGNGGILKSSRCGEEIDQADLVVRFNMPSMSFSEDVGTKTSLMTLNPSVLETKYENLQARRKPFADALQPYRDTFILIPAFSFVGHSDLSYRALYTVEDFGLKQQVFFLNPHYLSTLSNYWKKQGLKPPRLSSGFMFVSMALEFCEHITLYGFWPFPHDLADQPIPHHYYDNVLPKAGVHAMTSEFSHYLGMYEKGVLRLRLGKCQ